MTKTHLRHSLFCCCAISPQHTSCIANSSIHTLYVTRLGIQGAWQWVTDKQELRQPTRLCLSFVCVCVPSAAVSVGAGKKKKRSGRCGNTAVHTAVHTHTRGQCRGFSCSVRFLVSSLCGGDISVDGRCKVKLSAFFRR